MREVLESKRLKVSWEKLSRDELTPTERTAALDGIRRMLASAGQDMDSVLKMALVGVVMLERDRKEKAERAEIARNMPFTNEDFIGRRRSGLDDAFGPGFSAFKDVFSSSRRARSESAYGRTMSMSDREDEERRARLRPVTGNAVPAVVTGSVSLVERVTVKSGDVLVFQLENAFALYGPLIAMTESDIETIEAANRHSAQVRVSVRRDPDKADVNIVDRVSIAA